MDFQVIEQRVKAGYDQNSTQYRRDDEIEVTTRNHQRHSQDLRQICNSFPHPIDVLDAGCGTGRYFHCLTNVRRLTGIDIADEMLAAAANPVRAELVTVPDIHLMRQNAHLTDFPAGSFNFIYSFGMFGWGCPITVAILDKFHNWLAPGGKLLFNTVDMAGMPLSFKMRRRAKQMVYPILTRRLKSVLDERNARHPFFGLTLRGLEDIVRESRFKEFEVKSFLCESPLWQGRQLECMAVKES